MVRRSVGLALLLGVVACQLHTTLAQEPDFMKMGKKGKGGPPPGGRGRGPPEGMPDPETMDKDMEDMHTFWCTGQNRHHTQLCTVWYENEDERREAIANGKPPPPPKGNVEPELKEIGEMHKMWCAVAGNEKRGPCLMWADSPIKEKYHAEHDSL